MDPSTDQEGDEVRILVVDDHEENLVAIRGILDEPGYTVVSARSGNEALKHVLRDDFAVILMDVLMPLMDGFETARLIRGRDASRHTPIIFLTAASADLTMLERGYAAGAVDYLVKPLNTEMVRAKVAVFVDLYRKARQIRRQEEGLRAAERFKSEVAIRESEALYEASFNGAAIGIAHMTPAGEALRANPRFWQIVGYAPQDTKPFRVEDVCHPDDVADIRSGMEGLAAGNIEMLRRECRFRRRDGRVVWVDLTVSPLRDADGKVKNLVFLMEDVTGRRDAEKRERLLAGVSQILLESFGPVSDRRDGTGLDALARLVVGAIGDWCVISTVDAQEPPADALAIAHADPALGPQAAALRAALTTSLGYAADLSSTATMTSSDPAAELSRLWGIDARPVTELGVRAVLAVPLANHDRVLGRLMLLSNDAFSAGDMLAARDVAHRIALALDNARLHREAREAVRARDEFLSIASHELRTPLTPLRIHFHRLLDDQHQVLPVRPERLQTTLVRCERQVRRLESLIDKLFDVSRITSGRLTLELASVELGEVVRDVVARSAEELAAAACTITTDIRGPVVGRWDRMRVEQVVTNIVGNAMKYGAGKPIEISVEAAADCARLIVRDEGIGIEPADVERIFQRFHRVVSSPAYGGLGLGLYIAKQIVDAHGGTITVDSTPGAGTTFVVALPLEDHQTRTIERAGAKAFGGVTPDAPVRQAYG